MEHSVECLERMARAVKLRTAWLSEWPDYCRHCHGQGAHYYTFDPSPTGVSLSAGTMEDAEPCDQCTEQGICARCGKAGLDPETGEGPCSHCGWNYDDGVPEMPECFCWMDECAGFLPQDWEQ